MKATAKDLRIHTKEIVEAVKRGEEIILTYRGKPTARIIPISNDAPSKESKAEDTLFGIWKDNKDIDNVNEYIDKIRGGRFT